MTNQTNPIFGCDPHTHTIRSGHAFSTLDELVHAASDAGLELIAITDHGPSMEGAPHGGYFEMVGRLPPVQGSVRVLMGVEANIVSYEGDLDLNPSVLARQQVILAGLHERTGYTGGSRRENTKAIVRAIESGFVDIISHPYRPEFPVDISDLAHAAAASAVCLELNVALLRWALSQSSDEKRRETVRQTQAMVDELVRWNGNCVVSSDAHHSSEVRDFPHTSSELMQAMKVPIELVANRRADDFVSYLRSRR